VPDILAIVSKAVFDKDARVDGAVVGLGAVWPVDRYNTNNKTLSALESGGRIFLVTVRPPDEQLWLVGVIDSPKLKGTAWISAKKNSVPVTNISSLRKTIVFESGKGMSQDKGALGMSLQTPRALAAADVAHILAAVGGGAGAAPKSVKPAAPLTGAAALLAALDAKPNDELLRERTVRELVATGAFPEARQALTGVAQLNAHDDSGLPCLCKNCWETTGIACEQGGMPFKRDVVLKSKHALFYWAPAELETKLASLRNSVRGSLSRRLQVLAKGRRKRARPEF
jgi:hypothetical protein